MPDLDVAMRAYYARGREADRLSGPKGVVEFERTKEILARALPAAPGSIADIGGGPGRYALWLAGLGHRVEHRDLIELHVDQLRTAPVAGVRSAVADARNVDLRDASVDAVLLLGPLYHLLDRADRVRALREAARIVRPGGVVFAAAISRWAARLDGIVIERLYHAVELVRAAEETGILMPFVDDGFCAYLHRPDELAAEIADAGLVLEDLVGVEGLHLGSDDLAARLADPVAREALFDAARSIERVPELLGLSPHMVATARRSEEDATSR
jgi:SAM-dependent methyltransferase